MSSEQSPGEKNLHDAEFVCKLFRFLQLLCEGHNLGKLCVNRPAEEIRCVFDDI